jgi:hypothetical protein
MLIFRRRQKKKKVGGQTYGVTEFVKFIRTTTVIENREYREIFLSYMLSFIVIITHTHTHTLKFALWHVTDKDDIQRIH